MLLLRDGTAIGEIADRLQRHVVATRAVHAGRADLRTLQAGKLAETLAAAADARLYDDRLPRGYYGTAPEAVLASLPLLGKQELRRRRGYDAFARRPADFLHYYESSGTSGDPVAAPKALDDLVINTTNIGEMWARVIAPGDVALNLIIAPLAPAPYQFEKVLEYLGVMSLRPWVDYLAGDYTKVLRLIDELSVNVFVGAPSRLLAMIQFALRHELPAPRFERLLLIAEQMGPHFLRHLEHLTGARAYVGSYGSSETGTIAATCEHGQLHLQLQSYVLELCSGEDQDARLVDGAAGSGELVVTTLDLLARPLLRYRTGDLIEVLGEPCPCGVALPVMRTLGRATDVLAIPGGAVRQDDFEGTLWSDPAPRAPTALNYMLVIRGEEIVVLVTTDAPADPMWAGDLAERLAAVFPGYLLCVRPVDELSPLASITGDLGWKLSHVVELGDAQMWDRLPAALRAVVERTLSELEEVIA